MRRPGSPAAHGGKVTAIRSPPTRRQLRVTRLGYAPANWDLPGRVTRGLFQAGALAPHAFMSRIAPLLLWCRAACPAFSSRRSFRALIFVVATGGQDPLFSVAV